MPRTGRMSLKAEYWNGCVRCGDSQTSMQRNVSYQLPCSHFACVNCLRPNVDVPVDSDKSISDWCGVSRILRFRELPVEWLQQVDFRNYFGNCADSPEDLELWKHYDYGDTRNFTLFIKFPTIHSACKARDLWNNFPGHNYPRCEFEIDEATEMTEEAGVEYYVAYTDANRELPILSEPRAVEILQARPAQDTWSAYTRGLYSTLEEGFSFRAECSPISSKEGVKFLKLHKKWAEEHGYAAGYVYLYGGKVKKDWTLDEELAREYCVETKKHNATSRTQSKAGFVWCALCEHDVSVEELHETVWPQWSPKWKQRMALEEKSYRRLELSGKTELEFCFRRGAPCESLEPFLRFRGFEEMELSHHRISSVPTGWGLLSSTLRRLAICACQLTEIPDALAELKNLEHFVALSNNIRNVSRKFCQLASLKQLHLDSNHLEDMRECRFAQNFEELKVAGNRLTSLPQLLNDAKGITTIRAHGNQIRELPDCMEELGEVTELCLQGNLIETLPQDIHNMSKLRELNLADNLLTFVPDTVNNLYYLKDFILYGNRLCQLPSLSKMKNLRLLLVENNKFKESFISKFLKHEASQMQSLQVLGVDEDQIWNAQNKDAMEWNLPACVSRGRLVGNCSKEGSSFYLKLVRARNLLGPGGACTPGEVELIVVAFAASQGAPEWAGELKRVLAGDVKRQTSVPFDEMPTLQEYAQQEHLKGLNPMAAVWQREISVDPLLRKARGTDFALPEMKDYESPDFDILFCCDPKQRWYSSGLSVYDIKPFEERVKNVCSKYKKVLFVGASMGGFAALTLSPLADRVLVFHPQVDLEQSHLRPGFDTEELQRATKCMHEGVAKAAEKGVRFEVHCEMDEHLVYSQKLKLPKGSLIVHATHYRRLAEHLKKANKLRSILATQIHDVIAHDPLRVVQSENANDSDKSTNAIDTCGWEWGQTEPTLCLAVHHFKDDGFTWVKLAPSDLKPVERESEGLCPVAAPRPRDWFCPGQTRDGGRCGFRNHYEDGKCRSKRSCYVKKSLINVASVMMPGEEQYFSCWTCPKCDSPSTKSQCCDEPAEFAPAHVVDGFIEQGDPEAKIGRLVTIDGRVIEFDFQPYQWFLAGEKVRFDNPFKSLDEPHFKTRSVTENGDFPMECDVIISDVTKDSHMASVTCLYTTNADVPVNAPFGYDLPLLLCDESVEHCVGEVLNRIFVFKDDRAGFFLCSSKEEKVTSLLREIRRPQDEKCETQDLRVADNMQLEAAHSTSSSHSSTVLRINASVSDGARSSFMVSRNATDTRTDTPLSVRRSTSEELVQEQKDAPRHEATPEREANPGSALREPPSMLKGDRRETDQLPRSGKGRMDEKSEQKDHIPEHCAIRDNEYVVKAPSAGPRWSVEPHAWNVPVAREREREKWAEQLPKPPRNGRKDIWKRDSRGTGTVSLTTELVGDHILSALQKDSPAGKVISTIHLAKKNLTPDTTCAIFRCLACAKSIKSIRIYDNPYMGRLDDVITALGPRLVNQVVEWHLTGCRFDSADVIAFLRMFEGRHKTNEKTVKFVRLDAKYYGQEAIHRYVDQFLWVCDADRSTCPSSYVCERNCDVHIPYWPH